MMRARRTGLVRVCTAVALWASVSIADAAGQQVLPPFLVESPEGRTESIQELSTEPQWLIVYVTPNCSACNRLLDALAAWQSPAASARTVVIASGDPVAVRAFVASRHAAAATSRLYRDEQMQLPRALGLVGGGPAIVAMRRGQIEWVLSGVLNDPDALEPVMRAWVEY